VSPDGLAGLPRCEYEVVATFPHRRDAFTQGLAFGGGRLYEGTGVRGQSALSVFDAPGGTVVRETRLADRYFGEGVTVRGDRVYQLTWRDGVGFVYDGDTLGPAGQFRYRGEGWGLTHDGDRLVMSDGTAVLRFLDPESLAETRRLTVRAAGQPLANLNELEYVAGEILANVWQTDTIVRIAPATGEVLGWLDLERLRRLQGPASVEAVTNGIAFDPPSRRLLVTGKLWSALYQIRPTGEGCGALLRAAGGPD